MLWVCMSQCLSKLRLEVGKKVVLGISKRRLKKAPINLKLIARDLVSTHDWLIHTHTHTHFWACDKFFCTLWLMYMMYEYNIYWFFCQWLGDLLEGWGCVWVWVWGVGVHFVGEVGVGREAVISLNKIFFKKKLKN